jgi:Spy/CpxP family protein refolding chaperone
MIPPLELRRRHDNKHDKAERYMKLSKTMILAALTAASLFAAGSAPGQNTTPNAPAGGASTTTPPRAPRQRMDIAKMLNLTDDQKAKVQPILDAQRQKMRAVFQDDSLQPEDKRTKLKAIQEDTSAQLKPILTPEQFATWQKLQTRVRRMSPPGGNAPTPGAPAAGAPATPPAAAPKQ